MSATVSRSDLVLAGVCVAIVTLLWASLVRAAVGGRLADLVKKFVHGLAYALQPLNLRHSQIRIGDVPAFCRDLMFGEVILRSWAANARPAVPGGVDYVEIVGYLCHEVVNVGVPIAVKGRGEEQPSVVVEEHEAHGVEGADLVGALREVAPQQPQERPQPLGAARRQRHDDCQLRYLTETRADAAGAFNRRWQI